MMWIYTWNLKWLFNWMIPNLYIGNGCFTKHLFINGCLGFQVYIPGWGWLWHFQELGGLGHCEKTHRKTWRPFFWEAKAFLISQLQKNDQDSFFQNN